MEPKQDNKIEAARKILEKAAKAHRNEAANAMAIESVLGCCDLSFPGGGRIRQSGVNEQECKNAASAGSVPPKWRAGDC